MRRFLFLLASLSLLSSGAFADFAAGMRAYEAKNYAVALAEWQPLADQGDAKAQNGLGSLYQINRDYQNAAIWYRKAADQGLAMAQTNLGLLYAYGRGVARDDEEARKWYQKAADQGHPRAQNFIGYRYLKGHGVAQDYIAAEMWFALSGPGTDQEDADARAEVAKNLTADQMAQALRLAQEWRVNRTSQTNTARVVAPVTPFVATAPIMPTNFRWSAGTPGCEQRWMDGKVVEIVTLPGLQAKVSVQATPDGLFVAMIGVSNLGTVPMDVLPFNFSIQMTNPLGIKLRALPPEKAMAKQSLTGTIAAAIAGAAQGWSDASLKRTDSATVTNPDGSTSHVDIYSTGPTQQEVDQRNRAAQARRDEAVASARFNQGIRDISLAATTVDPQNEVSGAVWFPREKKNYREVMIEMPIGGTVLQFPFRFK